MLAFSRICSTVSSSLKPSLFTGSRVRMESGLSSTRLRHVLLLPAQEKKSFCDSQALLVFLFQDRSVVWLIDALWLSLRPASVSLGLSRVG